MRSRAAVVVLAIAIMLAGCTDYIRREPAAEAIGGAPTTVIERPLREQRPTWLLLGEAGWCGAHLTRFGGEAEDQGSAIFRVATFRDESAATHAFQTLTPESLYRLYRVKMLAPPYRFEPPVPLPGVGAFEIEYDARLPFELPPDERLQGQMLATRAGRSVILVEGIGVPPEQLAAGLLESVRVAERLAPGCGGRASSPTPIR